MEQSLNNAYQAIALLERYCYILTLDPAQKYYSKVIHRKEVTHSNERDRVGGLRLMIWEKVKVPFCHYSHAPEESNL